MGVQVPAGGGRGAGSLGARVTTGGGDLLDLCAGNPTQSLGTGGKRSEEALGHLSRPHLDFHLFTRWLLSDPPGAEIGTCTARRWGRRPVCVVTAAAGGCRRAGPPRPAPARPRWPRPVPAGSPAPCRAAGGPAASWGSWSAAAAPCRGICRGSRCSGGCPPPPPTAPPASSSLPGTPGGRDSGPASRSSRQRPAPPPRAREGAAPNAWWATQADSSARGAPQQPGTERLGPPKNAAACNRARARGRKGRG